MKRLFSLLIMLVLVFSLFACTKSEPIKPNTDTNKTDDTSSPAPDKDKTETTDTDNNPVDTGVGFIDPNKKFNKSLMPTADVDKLNFSQAKTAELKGKTLTFYTSETGAFTAGALTETNWFDEIAKKFEAAIKYTVRPDNMLVSSQAIAQKSGLALDLISTKVSDVAQSQTLMQQAFALNGTETNLPFSKRVFDMSGGKVLSAVGNGKMLWYNTDIISDSKAYDYFANGEWTDMTLDFVANDARDAKKNVIECDNWAAFGSAAGVQVTGISPEGYFVFAPESQAAMDSFKTFAEIFDTVSTKRETFKNGGTAFCYTADPVLDKGGLSFVPIPGLYQRGTAVTELSGAGIGISKTVTEENKPFAMTLALLWATRYSEARTDALMYTYGLGAQKTGKYINCCETLGSLYNADAEISAMFDMPKLTDKLYTDSTAVMAMFAPAYTRAYVLNNRK